MLSTPETLPTSLVDELSRNPIVSALLGQLPVGVVIASRDGRLEHVNEIAHTFLEEHRLLRAVPEPWVVSAAERDDVFEPIHWIIARALLTREMVRDEEVEYVDARDEWRTLSVSATPIRNADGEVTHAVLTFQDVTGRNQARAWEPLVRSLSRL
jgi:PAS domain-containing protein